MVSCRILLRYFRRQTQSEPSRLLVGATGSGKSAGELADLVRLARRGDHAIVLLDGHGPLAFQAAGHWVARGQESRVLYEPLDAVDRVLSWPMLPRSTAASPSRQRLEDSESRDEVVQCFLAQRSLETLTDRPFTKEWLEAGIALAQAQSESEPLSSLPAAFRIGSCDYERLLRNCTHPVVREKFRNVERLKRKNEVQYEIQTGAARRLIESVCDSEVVRLRCRSGRFDWLAALRERKLIALDGGGLRSRELKRTFFLLAALQVVSSVQRHFAATGVPLPVVLVLEEAGALGLVAPFVLHALQELRKAGLAIHLITQSSLDFGSRGDFEAMLANVPSQWWFQSLTPADQELGAKVLANATFEARSVHYHRTRIIPDGVPPGHLLIPRRFSHYKAIDEEHYKSPQLHEQEYRTLLATLRVGECLVRDRSGVRRKHVRPLRPPRGFDAATSRAIARIRSQPPYLSVLPEEPAPQQSLPDAAERLRTRGRESGDRTPH